jgi:hypothetical protein
MQQQNYNFWGDLQRPPFLSLIFYSVSSGMKYTKRISKGSNLKFLPKLQLKFPTPIDKLVQYLLENPDDTEWHESVIEIWQNQSSWKCLYQVPNKD